MLRFCGIALICPYNHNTILCTVYIVRNHYYVLITCTILKGLRGALLNQLYLCACTYMYHYDVCILFVYVPSR